MGNREVPSKKEVTYLRRKILSWFKENGRHHYPWRNTDDPYKVLIAEMMLQRTRADQVEDVYKEFFDRFQGPEEVADTPQEQLNEILEPLGLRWRFSNFKSVSEDLVELFDGEVPSERKELKRLTGVAQYVSGLVQSVAFGKRAWIVDSNVVRVYERFFGLDTKNEARRDSLIIEVAKLYAETTKPREANLGLIDFGALICTPSEKKNSNCPVRHRCVSWKASID
jgi:A/G-specific adenine glycosylase